jgi:hypothetical protein
LNCCSYGVSRQSIRIRFESQLETQTLFLFVVF